MKNSIGDEVSRENIYGIMQMSEQNNNRKKNRKAEEEKTQFLIFPKNQSQQKRQSSMSREKKIIAVKNTIKYCTTEKIRADEHASGERTDMSQTDENWPDKCKKSDTFHSKRHVINPSHAHKNTNYKQNYRSPYENPVYFVYSDITKHNIRDGITGGASGIITRHKLRKKTGAQQ